MNNLYDPPIASSTVRPSRSRSASLSTSISPQAPADSSIRRQSFSAARAQPNLSDEEQEPLVDLGNEEKLASPSSQLPEDAALDLRAQRDGRQSKQQMQDQKPNSPPMTSDMEAFMAQLYDLTHAIDSLENDVDEILALRNKIASLDPRVDPGQESIRADLESLAALTTQSGKAIVSLETWLLQLHKWSKDVKKLVKAGKAGETMQEIAEIKSHLGSAKLDFADAMERIREGAYREQERRERTRLWMAEHIRTREPGVDDRDVRGLLKAAELGAADGVAESHVTSYAGLWALQNPFTELAELTDGMRFLNDDLDREIVDQVTGKSTPKRIINLDAPTTAKSKKSKSKSNKSLLGRTKSSKTSPVAAPAPAPVTHYLGSRYGVVSALRPKVVNPSTGDNDDGFDRRFRYIQAEQYGAEKDLEYGFARQAQLAKVNRRKKLIIALLIVIIAALILFVVLATMEIPDLTATTAAPSSNQSTITQSNSSVDVSPFMATQPTTTTTSAAVAPTQSSSSPTGTSTTTSAGSSTSTSTSSGSSSTSSPSSLSPSTTSSTTSAWSSTTSSTSSGTIATTSTSSSSDGDFSQSSSTATAITTTALGAGTTTMAVGGATTSVAETTTVWWTASSA